MDEEDWKEFASILDRRALANSYIKFVSHMWDEANNLARTLDSIIWRELTKERYEKPDTT